MKLVLENMCSHQWHSISYHQSSFNTPNVLSTISSLNSIPWFFKIKEWKIFFSENQESIIDKLQFHASISLYIELCGGIKISLD